MLIAREEPHGRFANPFKPKKKIRLSHLAPAAFLGIIIVWISLMLYLPYFRITEVTITGLKIIKPAEINTLIQNQFLSSGKIWPKNNYFLVRESAIANALQKKFALNTITVTKIFPHTITISLEEKVSSAIYDNGSTYWLIDKGGTAIQYLRDVTSTEFVASETPGPTSTQPTVASLSSSSTFAEASSTIKILTHVPDFNELQRDYGKYPLIYDTRTIPIIARQANILSPTVIQGIIDFFNGLQEGVVAQVEYMTMGDPEAGVTVITDRPWKILFQPTDSISTQLENLQIVLRDNHPTQYVDVRFGERIYWK